MLYHNIKLTIMDEILGSGEQRSRLHMACKALLMFLSPCYSFAGCASLEKNRF